MIEHTKGFVASIGEGLFEKVQRIRSTDKIVQKCALLALGFFAASLLFPKPWSLLSLGLVFLVFRNSNNYSSLESLSRMRREAETLSFSELISLHGSIERILDFQILRPEKLREKLQFEMSQLDKIPLKLREEEKKISQWETDYQERAMELLRL
jgi:hypothetical protein